MRAAVDAYYDRVAAGDAAGAWDLLSPAYQARQGEDEYLAFWDSVESVEVRGRPRVDEDGGPAEATLEFRDRRTVAPASRTSSSASSQATTARC